MHCFGRRRAWAAPVALRSGAPSDRCVMAAMEAGWVFLLPVKGGRASLQLISIHSSESLPSPAQVVGATRAVRDCVGEVGAWSDPVPSMARIRLPVGKLGSPRRPGRIAIGEAAVAFDPICGDGVGHALRGAVLTTIVLQTVARGASPVTCLGRYSSMLRRTMSHHLGICLRFYRDIAIYGGWCDEIVAMEDGVRFLTDGSVLTASVRGRDDETCAR